MQFQVFSIDAFTGPGCQGSLAGVCTAPSTAPDKELREVARRFGAPETAFLFKDGRGLSIRWFTPELEVDLCGHATLAAAAWLWDQEKPAERASLTFQSKGGELQCTRTSEGIVEVHFPELPVIESTPEPGLLAALGIKLPLFVGKSKDYFLVEVPNESDVAQLAPDFDRLKDLECAGAFVTSRGSGAFDFVSRCFFPKEGIPEDPVTGSAHCTLGPFWRAKLSKDRLRARQSSSRGGDIRIRFSDSKVVLGGTARVHRKASLYCTK